MNHLAECKAHTTADTRKGGAAQLVREKKQEGANAQETDVRLLRLLGLFRLFPRVGSYIHITVCRSLPLVSRFTQHRHLIPSPCSLPFFAFLVCVDSHCPPPYICTLPPFHPHVAVCAHYQLNSFYTKKYLYQFCFPSFRFVLLLIIHHTTRAITTSQTNTRAVGPN